MDNTNMDNRGKILLGFLAGAAAGAIAGILLAPDKGQVTRKNITDATSKLSDNVNRQVQKSVDKISSLKESAFSLVNDYAGNGSKGSNGSSATNNQNM